MWHRLLKIWPELPATKTGPSEDRRDAVLLGLRWMETHQLPETNRSDRMSDDDARERKTTLTDGSPVTPDHREDQSRDRHAARLRGAIGGRTGERVCATGRQGNRHLTCGTVTNMHRALSETYARQPDFDGGTYCCRCRAHFPVGAEGQFVWDGTDEKVGT